jgi:hypothetical protein
VAVLSAGCGQAATTSPQTTPSAKTSVELIASTAAATTAARTARMVETTTMTGFTGASKPLHATASGVVAFEREDALLDFLESTPQRE